MITKIFLKKEILATVLVDGYKGVCPCVKDNLKTLIGCVPANNAEDICLIFSDGIKTNEGEVPGGKEGERFPEIKQRLRISSNEKDSKTTDNCTTV